MPLTDEQRSAKARAEFAKAMLHLGEAEKLAAWGQAPNACAHAAYYAMHHCACAAILIAGGVGKYRDVPKSHEHVIEHYGVLTASEGGLLGESGKALSRARTDRTIADYDLGQTVSTAEASAMTADAKRLVEACARRWRLRPDSP